MKANAPFIVPVAPLLVRKDSLITLPSLLTPVTTTLPSAMLAAVPPVTTLRARGTSGFVIPLVTVWADNDVATAAITAVLEAAATFL